MNNHNSLFYTQHTLTLQYMQKYQSDGKTPNCPNIMLPSEQRPEIPDPTKPNTGQRDTSIGIVPDPSICNQCTTNLVQWL